MIPAATVTLGAVVVENHLTLDHNLVGPDHTMSLEPMEFIEMIDNIRQVEVALREGVKKITDTERSLKEIARKSIVANIKIPKGTVITRGMLRIKRPGTG